MNYSKHSHVSARRMPIYISLFRIRNLLSSLKQTMHSWICLQTILEDGTPLVLRLWVSGTAGISVLTRWELASPLLQGRGNLLFTCTCYRASAMECWRARYYDYETTN